MEDHSIILQKLKEDPDEAFILIYKAYFSRLCFIAYNHLRNPEDAEDIVQELLADIWNRRMHLKIHSTLDGYLIKSLLYKINSFRQKKKIQISENGMENPETPSVRVEAAELRKLIDGIIQDLPGRKKECFLLSRSENLTHNEIARQLGISPKTVDHHITDALRLIREKLKQLYFTLF